MKILLVTLTIAMALGAVSQAKASGMGSIGIEHAWARATPKGAPNGVVYITLVNSGSERDQLVSATSPVAENIQFHEAKDENGISRMRRLTTIDVPPKSKVILQPSGIHLMLRLKQPLMEGDVFPLTLIFQNAGAMNVIVKVGKVGAMNDMGDM